jgi:hypothetical protein
MNDRLNIQDSLREAFPWADVPVLAKALNDNKLWAFTISNAGLENADIARREVKRLIKKFSASEAGSVSVENDDSFGRGLKGLIATREGRKQLFDFIGEKIRNSNGRQWIASRVFLYASFIGTVPRIQDIANEREEARHYLDLQKFDQWLAANRCNDDMQYQTIAIVGCAFAILQPEIGGRICEVLARHFEQGREWLCPVHQLQLNRQKRRKKRKQLSTETISTVSQTDQNLVATESKPALEDCMKRLSSFSPTECNGAIKKLREFSQILEAKYAEISVEIRRYESLRKKVEEKLSEILNEPELESTFQALDFIDVDETSSIADAFEVVSNAIEDANAIQNSILTARELCSRLGVKPSFPQPSSPSLGAYLSDLKAYLLNLQADIERLAQRDRQVDAVLSAFIDTPIRHRPDFVSMLSLDEILTLTSSMYGQRASGMAQGQLLDKIWSDFHVVGLLGAVAACLQTDQAYNVILSAFTACEGDRIKQEQVLRHLSFHQFQELANHSYELREAICEFTLGSSIVTDELGALSLLRPLISLKSPASPVWGLYEALVDESELRGESSFYECLATATYSGEPSTFENTKLRSALAHIDQKAPPAAGAMFHILREDARNRFLKPLEQLIKNGEIEKAWRIWTTTGSNSEKAESCVAKIPRKERRYLESKHREKTESYLEGFEQLLSDLLESKKGKSSEQSALSKSLQAFRAVASKSDSKSRRALEFLNANKADNGIQWPKANFGRLVEGNHLTAQGCQELNPAMLNSWIAFASSDPVSVFALTADTLAMKLGAQSSNADSRTIDFFVNSSCYAAVRQTIEVLPQLEEYCNRVVGLKRDALVESELVVKAKALRRQDDEIDFALTLFYSEIEAGNIVEAEAALADLEKAIKVYEFLADEENAYLYRFATEVGINPVPLSREKLADLSTSVKQLNESRRIHIAYLNDFIRDLPLGMRPSWESIVWQIDSPNKWPSTEDKSLQLADFIDYFTKYIANRSEGDLSVAVATKEFVSFLVGWFRMQIVLSLSNPEAPDIYSFHAVRNGRDNFWDDNQVLSFIKHQLAETKVADILEVAPTLNANDTVEPDLADQTITMEALDDKESPEAKESIESIRRFISKHLAGETDSVHADADLRSLCFRKDWESVRAAIVADPRFRSAPPARISDEEWLYLLALGFSQDKGNCHFNESLELACLAATMLKASGQYYYITKSELMICFRQLFCILCGSDGDQNEQERDYLAGYIRRIADAPPADPERQQLYKLLRLCRRGPEVGGDLLKGDSILAEWMWEGVTGTEKFKVADVRADLILVLYAFDQKDALRNLAVKFARKHSTPITQCLTAFKNGESNPEALEEAQQLVRVIVENAAGEKIAPWERAITSLDRALKDISDAEPLTVKDESISLDGKNVIISLSLTPARYDWPTELKLEIGTQDQEDRFTVDLLEGRTLTYRRLKTIKVPLQNLERSDTLIRIPFSITGSSDRTNQILLRGAWAFNPTASHSSVKKLTQSELKTYWPYADGHDVKDLDAYHGRRSEWEKIDLALQAASGFQQSVMVIGQRRIGKTSLLNKVLASYPMDKHRCAAVYANIGGFDKKGESLSQAVCDRVLEQLEADPARKNAELSNLLSKHGVTYKRLFKDIRAKKSLTGGLEGIASVLSELTNGKVQRIAFCLDEFQDIFGWRDQADVRNLMWDLRPIVQGSRSVSLVLAGSGAIRRLVESYDEAFFGSIEIIKLLPFSFETEADAVADTFLPQYYRDSIAPDMKGRIDLFRTAHEITGGHPWYLSILGSAMASMFGISRVTPAMLHHVAEELVKGRLNRMDKSFVPENFYGYMLASLNILDERVAAIAQLVLVEIARNTTTDWRNLALSRLMTNEILSGCCEKGELRTVISNLYDEGIIEKSSNEQIRGYRLNIPLVSESLKQHADQLIEKSLITLGIEQ